MAKELRAAITSSASRSEQPGRSASADAKRSARDRASSGWLGSGVEGRCRKRAGSTDQASATEWKCFRSASRASLVSCVGAAGPGARARMTPERDPKRLYTVILDTPARRAIAAMLTEVAGASAIR